MTLDTEVLPFRTTEGATASGQGYGIFVFVGTTLLVNLDNMTTPSLARSKWTNFRCVLRLWYENCKWVSPMEGYRPLQ